VKKLAIFSRYGVGWARQVAAYAEYE